MGTILTANYKAAHDGVTESGPLIADAEGLCVGVIDRKEKTSLFKKRTVYKAGHYVMRWADTVGYDIAQPEASQFAGTTLNSYVVILTVKTATTQQSFKLHHTNVVRVRNQLGPYLAQVDSRLAS